MDEPYLAELLSYPVKSLAGGSHKAAQVHPWGVAQDRSWMIVDAAARFMTQREYPRMALLHAVVQEDRLVLSGPGCDPLTISPVAGDEMRAVTIWRDKVPAQDCGDSAATWLGAALGAKCRLVHLANPNARKLSANHAARGDEVVSFADGFPVLLASRASLADLNARLGTPVPMSRFRPNLVVAEAHPWAEDTWRRLRIGEVIFRVGKPCERCVMTTIDQLTGLQPDGNEPLTTLSRFRRVKSGKILFAQNLIPENTGQIATGDKVEILESGASNVKPVIKTGSLGGMPDATQLFP